MAKLLITREQLLRYTAISGETDMDKITPSLIAAEEIQVQSQLGTELYKKLKTLVDDDTINDTTNSDYKYILDTYIVQMLAHFTAAEFYLFHTFNVNNTGVTRPTNPDGILPDVNEIELLSQREEDRAIWYVGRFVDYMCNNSSLFPEWSTNVNDDISPQYGKNRSTWNLR